MGASSERHSTVRTRTRRRAPSTAERDAGAPPAATPSRPDGPAGVERDRRPRRRRPAEGTGPAAYSDDSPGRHAATSLDTAAKAFELLVQGPAPLSLDGRAVGGGLPRRALRLDELRALLLRPTTGRTTRDAAWRHLLNEVRGGSAAWMIGAVGVALPALRAIAADLADGPGADVADVHAAVLTGFMTGLHRIDADRPGVITRLRWHAYRAGLLARYTRDGILPMPPQAPESAPPPYPWGHPDLILADAVIAGVLSPLAAELIGRSRLEDLPLKQAAAELGVSYEAARKARQRGERRLIAAITAGDVQNRVSPPARKTGLTPTRTPNPTTQPGKPTPPQPAGVRGQSTRSGGTPDTHHSSRQEGGAFRGPARQLQSSASSTPGSPPPGSSRAPTPSPATTAAQNGPSDLDRQPQRGRSGSQRHRGHRHDHPRGQHRGERGTHPQRGRGRPGWNRGGEPS